MAAISAADCACVCVNAHNGVQLNTRRAFDAAAKLGSKVGLYNHLGWFGEPTNQVNIIERLRARHRRAAVEPLPLRAQALHVAREFGRRTCVGHQPFGFETELLARLPADSPSGIFVSARAARIGM